MTTRKSKRFRPSAIPKVTPRPSSSFPEHNMEWYTQTHLNDLFQISYWYIVDRVKISLLIAIVIALSLVLMRGRLLNISPDAPALMASFLVCIVALILCQIIYWALWCRRVFVWVDGYSLRIQRGVLWKKRLSTPVMLMLTAQISQSKFEILVRRYTLQLVLVDVPDRDHVTFPFMKYKQAMKAKEYIVAQSGRQAAYAQSGSAKRERERVMGEVKSAK